MKQFNAVSVSHAPLEEAGVPVAVDDGEVSVAMLEPIVELPHVFVAVVVERRPVPGLESVVPAAHVSPGLAEESPDACGRGKE